jgi:hypothetical protein
VRDAGGGPLAKLTKLTTDEAKKRPFAARSRHGSEPPRTSGMVIMTGEILHWKGGGFRPSCGHSVRSYYPAIMAYEGTDFEPVFRWGQRVGVLAIVAGAVLFQATRKPAPPNSTVFGCYTNEKSMPIMLDKTGMHIVQKEFPTIPYHLERSKNGINLTADAPIEASMVGDLYKYSIRPPGESWYLSFYKDIDGHRYGVFNDNELSQFEMLARDGTDLGYSKAPLSACTMTEG